MTTEEKAVVKARVLRQVGHLERRGSLSVREIGMTMIDPIAWSNAVRYV